MVKKTLFTLFVILLLGTFAHSANATHSWGGYHWARTANPLSLKLGSNITSSWVSYLQTASSDWSQSSVLVTSIVSGATKGNCQPTKGRVEVCNKTYGNNGWLGLAQVWISGSHITQATTKLNDTYFNTAKYNTPEWRQFVICQEVGHTFGLDHQDENFDNANLNTCMDYTSNPSTNQHPNLHDYEQLATIYLHLDSTNTALSSIANSKAVVDLDNPSAWGKSIRESSDKKTSVFERDLGRGNKVFTFVVWAQ
jgi:hypothetical protein